MRTNARMTDEFLQKLLSGLLETGEVESVPVNPTKCLVRLDLKADFKFTKDKCVCTVYFATAKGEKFSILYDGDFEDGSTFHIEGLETYFPLTIE